MQVVLLLAECEISRAVDEKLQCPGTLTIKPCVPVATVKLTVMLHIFLVIAEFLMLDHTWCPFTDAGLAAAVR